MLKDANTILLFTDQRAAIDYLSDEDAGQLFKAILAYADEGNLPDFKGPMMSLFTVIRSQIERSREAYKAKCEKNRSNSMKRKIMQGNSKGVSMDNERNPSLSTDNDRCPPTTTVIHPNPIPKPNPFPNPSIDDGADTHIINDAEVVVDEEYPFDKIWEMYGKHIGDIEQLRQRWQQLSLDEKKKSLNTYPCTSWLGQTASTARISPISLHTELGKEKESRRSGRRMP